MARILIVYFSGFGHTAKQADAVLEGAAGVPGSFVLLQAIDPQGDIPNDAWEELPKADAIIYGTPTYMGGPAWQFKKFAESTSRLWSRLALHNQIAAGFTNSASVNGDKFSTLAYLWTLSQQHGQIWVGTGLLPSSKKEHGPADVNWTGSFGGAMAISPSDASPDEAPRAGDLETARRLGRRVAESAQRWKRGLSS